MPENQQHQHARSAQSALDSAHDADVLREQQSAELRIVVEAGPRCPHLEINEVRAAGGSTFDDHETVWGRCGACGEWVISTTFSGPNRRVETRVMTDLEAARFERDERRIERQEWLDDYRAGA